MVTKHTEEVPQGIALPGTNYRWGTNTVEALMLANDLITEARGRPPADWEYGDVLRFIDRVIVPLPNTGTWTMTEAEVKQKFKEARKP